MATSVFKRREKKYLITPGQRHAIESAARVHMAPDAYGRTLVTSVYLDTPRRSMIARSLEGPLYKEKLRLRTYGERSGAALLLVCTAGLPEAMATHGTALLEIPAFFELKKKFRGIVYKRRVRMSLPGAWAFARGASYQSAQATFPLSCRGEGPSDEQPPCQKDRPDGNPVLDRQIAREIEAALERHGELAPSAAIMCWRTAWAPLDETDEPRITFDDELCFVDLMGQDTQRKPITHAGESIMEIKASSGMPPWLVEALSETDSYPRSFSKYGEAARIMNDMERNTIDA